MNQRTLAGKVAVVTGGGRGIGRTIALALAGDGASVVIAGRSAEHLSAVVDEIVRAGGQAVAVPTDVRLADSVEDLAARAVAEFGTVDILVNNSGVLATRALLDQEVGEWDALYATNVRGTYLVTRAVGRHLVAKGSGKVINVASNFALRGIANHAAYSSSKAAILGFTRAMAAEWARHNIQVNAIAPGYFATDFNADARSDPKLLDRIIRGIPARRTGAVEELAPWVVLLAGPGSDFMTGSTVVIDGGQSA